MDERSFSITGSVTVKQGEKIIFQSKPNKILLAGYKYFACLMMANYPTSATYWGAQKGMNIRFGTGTTANSSATTALATALAVDPTLKTGSGWAGSENSYEVHFVGAWNAGLINASLGANSLQEIGLFLGLNSTYPTAIWTTTGITFTQQLFARIVLGGDAFIPDVNLPVTVDWKIGVDFV